MCSPPSLLLFLPPPLPPPLCSLISEGRGRSTAREAEKPGAGVDAGDDYVMFISSLVVSLVMSHVRVPSLCADGGGGGASSRSVGGFGNAFFFFSRLSLPSLQVFPFVSAKAVAAFPL